VIATYPTTEPDGSMRVRCTVTEDRHLKDCVDLSLSPQLASLTNGGRSKDFDERVERWTAGRPREPGIREFVIKFQPPGHTMPQDAGTPGPSH